MIVVRQTGEFAQWLDGLRDIVGRRRIAQRLVRLEAGLFGDFKSVGGGVSELRIDVGPGYRVYFVRDGAVVVILLCGGDKGSQGRDIGRALALAREWKDGDAT